jgi:hypothetical protein
MSVFDHFPDPDPGFRAQKSTGSRIDPQHCFVICNTCFYDFLKKTLFSQLLLVSAVAVATLPPPQVPTSNLSSTSANRKNAHIMTITTKVYTVVVTGAFVNF